MLKKLLAGLTAIALSLGMVALTAGPASAHHNTINAVVSCNTGTEGTWKVTWTIANSESIPETITSSNDTSIVPVDTVIAGGATLTVIRYYSTKPTSDKTLTLAAKWTNNNTATNSGKLFKDDFKDNCLPDDTSKKIFICHATSSSSNPYTRPEVSVSSIITNDPNGHGTHEDDIIPPFTYVKQGVDGSYPGKNWTTYGQWLYNNGCSNEVTPTAPTFTVAACTGPGTYGMASYTIPSTTGVQYKVSINDGPYTVKAANIYPVAVGTKVEVYAEELSGYELKGSDSQWQWSTTFQAPDCDVDVTPTKPTIVQAVCTGEGQVGDGTFTIPAITGIQYRVWDGDSWEVIGAGPHAADDGDTVQIRAYPLSGYDLTDHDPGKEYKSYNLTFTNIDSSKCDVPAAPTFTAQVCTGPGTSNTASYTIPSDNGIKYQVRINGGSWQNVSAGTVNVTVFPRSIEVQALANGNIIVPGSDVYWSFNFVAAGDCIVDAPSVAPSWSDAYCYAQTTGTSPASFTVNGTPGDHVSYWISTTGENGTYSPIADGPHNGTIGQTVWIKAVPDSGYKLTGYTGPWSHTFTDPGDCLDDGVPADPTFVDGSCVEPGTGVNDGYYVVNGGTNVSYEVKINDGSWTPVDPTTYGVKVYVNPGDKVEIKAVPDSGYKLTGDEQGPWSHTFTDPGECLDKAPVDPIAHVDQECEVDDEATGAWHYEPGTITIPTTPHVTYSIDGIEKSAGTYEYDPGVYVISAEADPGYYLTGVPDPWEVEILKDLPCGLPTYPTVTPTVSFVQTTCTVAGSYTLGVDPAELAEGVIWTVSGGLPNTLGKHAVNTAGTVTITATPAPGYGFGDGLPGSVREWKFDFTSLPDDCLPTLALTGSSIATGGLGLAGLLTLGGILLIRAHRRRAALIEQ
jgi:hypothetical protein